MNPINTGSIFSSFNFCFEYLESIFAQFGEEPGATRTANKSYDVG